MKILIVGGGIGGLTLAAFLKRYGINTLIVEQARHFVPVGFSIGIWNNGRRVLRDLGLEKKFDVLGYSLPEVTFADGRGKIFKKYNFKDFKKEFSPTRTQILRDDLHKILREAARGIPTKFGVTISSIIQNNTHVLVKFTDETSDVFDVVVGADGVHSLVRRLIFGNGFVHPTGWRGWFFWIDKALHPLPRGTFEMWEPGEFFGAFPHGHKKISAYLAMPWGRDEQDMPQFRIQKIRRHFTNLKWVVPDIIGSLTNPDELVGSDILDVRMSEWYKGRIILIGDAAHAMEPFGGMGASMAIEDALVLAEEIAQTKESHPNLAFERYTERRKKRVDLAQRQTRQLWRWSKMGNPILKSLRKLALRVIPIQYFIEGYKILMHDPI